MTRSRVLRIAPAAALLVAAAAGVARAEDPPCYCIDLDPRAIAEIAQHDQISEGQRKLDGARRQAIARMQAKLEAALREAKHGDDTAPPPSVYVTDRAVCARIPADRLFPKGSDRLTGGGKALVTAIGGAVSSVNGARVEVHAHGDDQTPRKWEDVWERTLRYAGRVLHQLVDSGVDARRLAAIAHGQASPIAREATDEARAENRRVEICVEPPPDLTSAPAATTAAAAQ